jgi:hypothetical protein
LHEMMSVLRHSKKPIGIVSSLNALVRICRSKVHKQLVERRTRLNEHVERLHSKRQPTGLSIYDMQVQLLRLGHILRTTAR